MIVNFTGAWDVKNITKAVKDTNGRFVFATKCKNGQWAFLALCLIRVMMFSSGM
jgi:hypothetical protein